MTWIPCRIAAWIWNWWSLVHSRGNGLPPRSFGSGMARCADICAWAHCYKWGREPWRAVFHKSCADEPSKLWNCQTSKYEPNGCASHRSTISECRERSWEACWWWVLNAWNVLTQFSSSKVSPFLGIEAVIDYLLGSPLLQSLGIRWSDKGVKLAVCEEHAFPSRDYWRCYARQKSSSDMHPTSTCRMGPNSSVAVVDSKLRVFGTSGLRVIDASVMPTVPSGNTHFPAMMVGEIGAQIILQGD